MAVTNSDSSQDFGCCTYCSSLFVVCINTRIRFGCLIIVIQFKFILTNMLVFFCSRFSHSMILLSTTTHVVWHVLISSFLLQESINSSLLNLLTYPWIEKRVNEGTLNLHGGYYNFVDCTFEKWTLLYREGLEGGSKYAIKNRSTWSWPMKALFTWVNFTLSPAVHHGFALPLRCSFPLHLAPLWFDVVQKIAPVSNNCCKAVGIVDCHAWHNATSMSAWTVCCRIAYTWAGALAL